MVLEALGQHRLDTRRGLGDQRRVGGVGGGLLEGATDEHDALVVPILLLARAIGRQAGEINDSLGDSVRNTAALAELRTTNDSATRIVEGLQRGRTRLGG